MSEAASEAAKQRPRVASYQPLVIVLVAVCAGTGVDRAWGLPLAVWSTLAGTTWAAWGLLWQGGRDRTAAVVLLVSVAACGGLWNHLRWNVFAHDDLARYTQRRTQPACVEVVATKGARRLPAPDYSPMRIIPPLDRTRVEVRVVGIRDRAVWRPASGRARLTVDGHLLGVRAGDRLRVFAALSAPRPAANPGDYDNAAYHRAHRRLSQLRSGYPECVTRVGRRRVPTLVAWIDGIRSQGHRFLWRYLDQRRAELAAAVLLGSREEIGTERMQAFRETGTVHLLAISGLHVGIVAGALFLALRVMRVRRSRAVIVVATAAVLYTLLTDARPPAIRAMILVLVFCVSTFLGRPRLAFNSLAAAGLVVLLLNPADLFDTGVHLSFVAVAGLMWFAPSQFRATSEQERLHQVLLASRPWLVRVSWAFWRGVRLLAFTSALIWLLTMPLVMAQFHLFTPVAVLLNTVVWFPMALALVSGFAVLVFGWLFPPLAAVFGWCSNGSLWLLEWCVEHARELPGSHFWVPGPASWWLVGFYGGLAVLAAFPAIQPPRRWCVGLLAGWIAIGFAASGLPGRPDRLECTFLSVGHGCAIVLELPSGHTVLYDAGQFASPEYGARSVAERLWSRGITHIDEVILSHADADHYNMLPELLKRFSVGVVSVSPMMFEHENHSMNGLADAIREAGVPVREISADDRLQGEGERFVEVLHPSRDGASATDNANCVVLAIEHRGHRILIPGDLESSGLDDLLAAKPWDTDVLLAPHHGSGHSDPPGLAAWCKPEWVVISGGLNSYQPDTTASYLASGAQVLHTGEVGAVHVTIDSEGLHVECFLESGND
ncbi:MAG: ComEC/Rec2 family competence protein [Planctomycetes bacterium]|nr:ComEC/Rec2 family competence protein [Planctomycetota bacterium]